MAYQDTYGHLRILATNSPRERTLIAGSMGVSIDCEEFDLFAESDPYDYLYNHMYDSLSDNKLQ